MFVRAVRQSLIIGWMIILLTACGDMNELEKQAHVVVIGLDLGPKDHLVNVTFQIANPQVGTTQRSETQMEPPSDVLTFTADDIISAKEIANSVVSRKLTFSHLQTMIISEKLAKTSLNHHVIAASAGDPEMRREINVIVSKEEAAKFILKNKPKLETRPHKYYNFMMERWRDTGFVPYSTLNRYFQRLSGELFMASYATTERDQKVKDDEDDQLAGEVPQQSGDPVQMIGAAIFKEGKMIGKLTGEETRLILLLRRKALTDSFIISFPDPSNKDFRVSVRLLKPKTTKIKVIVKNGPPEVYVTVPLKVQILTIPSLTDYVLSVQNQQLLKQAMEDDLTKKTMKLIEKTQKEFGSEPFLWFLHARKNFWTLKQYDQFEWEEQYKDAKVHVKFDLVIESFGKQFKPAHIIKPYKKETD